MLAVHLCGAAGIARRAAREVGKSAPAIRLVSFFEWLYETMYRFLSHDERYRTRAYPLRAPGEAARGVISRPWGLSAYALVGGYEVESGLCVPDRPTLSYDFSHFRLGLPRPTDPPRNAMVKKWPFWVGTPRPTAPLLPQRAGRELFLILLSRFLPFFSDFDPDRPTRRAQRGAMGSLT